MAEIAKHAEHDWCHICGNRTDHTVDIWYPTNAEHQDVPLTAYVRICHDCGESIGRISTSIPSTREVRTARRKGPKKPSRMAYPRGTLRRGTKIRLLGPRHRFRGIIISALHHLDGHPERYWVLITGLGADEVVLTRDEFELDTEAVVVELAGAQA